MEKINTETLVSSLFLLGFDKVDSIFFTCILGKLDHDYKNIFEFEDSEISPLFSKYIHYNGFYYSLKEGITLDTNVSPVTGHVWPLGKALHTNDDLLRYLKQLDFSEILMMKINSISQDKLQPLNFLFSNKEKELICDIFGIHQKEQMQNEKYVTDFYDSEFSPYDFMCLFGALNASQRNYSFNKDNLTRFIALCKKNQQFDRLLKEVSIQNNGVVEFSEDLDNAMSRLKVEGLLYTISPQEDFTMRISESIPMAKLIKPRINYYDEMTEFLERYRKYEVERIDQIYQQLSNQEIHDIARTSVTLRMVKNRNQFK